MMIRYRDHCALVIAYIISRTGRAGQWSGRLFSIIQFYLTDQSVEQRGSPARAAGYTMGSSGQRGAAGLSDPRPWYCAVCTGWVIGITPAYLATTQLHPCRPVASRSAGNILNFQFKHSAVAGSQFQIIRI